jgi:hypothetical protein
MPKDRIERRSLFQVLNDLSAEKISRRASLLKTWGGSKKLWANGPGRVEIASLTNSSDEPSPQDDSEAESLFYRRGIDANTLTEELRNYLIRSNPHPLVTTSIGWCLLADPTLSAECPEYWKISPGNWILYFIIRNGRPPKKNPTNSADAAAAIANGDRVALGRHLLASPVLDDNIRKKLIDALDQNLEGDSQWRLKFKRRGGQPSSELGTKIREVIITLVKDRMLEEAKRQALAAGTNRPSWSDEPTYSTYPIWPKIAGVLKSKYDLEVGKATIRAAKARPPRVRPKTPLS